MHHPCRRQLAQTAMRALPAPAHAQRGVLIGQLLHWQVPGGRHGACEVTSWQQVSSWADAHAVFVTGGHAMPCRTAPCPAMFTRTSRPAPSIHNRAGAPFALGVAVGAPAGVRVAGLQQQAWAIRAGAGMRMMRSQGSHGSACTACATPSRHPPAPNPAGPHTCPASRATGSTAPPGRRTGL